MIAAALAAAGLACNLGAVDPAQTPSPTTGPSLSADTPSATERAAQMVGTYFCYGHEGGQLAAAAVLTLNPDGSAVDTPAPGLGGERRTGTWAYEPATGELTFGGELHFVDSEYSPGSGRIVVRLQGGVSRPHAERGVLTCEPQ